MADCNHRSAMPGPRIPMAHGTSPTEVCRCGSWRRVGNWTSRWVDGPIPFDAIEMINGEAYAKELHHG